MQRRFTLLLVAPLLFLSLPAHGEVPTALFLEGDSLPGGPAGHTVTSISNTAVSHNQGYAATVNTSDGVTTLSHAWGGVYTGSGSVLRTEGTFGQYRQDSWESFFGVSNQLHVAYSPLCTDTATANSGLDAVYLDGTKIMIEEEAYPHLTGMYWSFGSRPDVTGNNNPYFVGGITPTQGGSTTNRGLFYGVGTTPLLTGGGVIAGLPDTLDHSETVSFDYRFSWWGDHYIAEVQTVTGSSLNNNHMVIDGAVILVDGLPVSENGAIPVSAGGLPGERWDNFDNAGITTDGRWMFTGDTDWSVVSLDEIIVVDGVIEYREGDTLDGEVLSGSIEGAYMNEDGDVSFIWDIQGGTVEALYLNDRLLLKEGDEVDITGDGVADPGVVLTDFTGISALTMSDRDFADGDVRIYFTANIDIPPPLLAGRAMRESSDLLSGGADREELGREEAEGDSPEKTGGARAVIEGFFQLVASPTSTGIAGPDGETPAAGRAALLGVYPNPVRSGEARIRFSAPAGRRVSVDVFDIAGRHVRSLVAAAETGGERIVHWDGSRDDGKLAAPGVYFVRYASEGTIETKRVTLVR
ncbi:MAG: T9SS type A sorting domain-containing protein [Candidatus Eisenbacteria bacterium]